MSQVLEKYKYRCRVCDKWIGLKKHETIKEHNELSYKGFCSDECFDKFIVKLEYEEQIQELDGKILTELIVFEDIWKDLDEENWFVNYRSLIEDLQDVIDLE